MRKYLIVLIFIVLLSSVAQANDKEQCYNDCLKPYNFKWDYPMEYDIYVVHDCAIRCKIWWVDNSLDFNYKGNLYQCYCQNSLGRPSQTWIKTTKPEECIKLGNETQQSCNAEILFLNNSSNDEVKDNE